MGGQEPSLLGKSSAPAKPRAPASAPAPERPARRGRSAAPVFSVAGFWRRVAGAAIDAGIVLPVGLLLAWLAGTIGGVELPATRHRGLDFWLDLVLTNDPAMWGAIGLITAIGVIYLMLFQIVLAQTPGMRVMKMRIIDVYGDPPSVGRVAARTAGYLAGFVTLCLGFLWVGFDSERRGLHDWIAGTYVVKA